MSKTNPTRAEALSLLGSLLGDMPIKDKDGSTKTVPIASLIKPLWVPEAITIFYRQTRCLHCRTLYTEAAPTITLTMGHTKRPDKKKHMTTPPDTDIPEGLPLRTEILQGDPIPYCTSCIGNATPFAIHGQLLRQAEAAKLREQGLRKERQAQAQARDFTTKDPVEPEVGFDTDDLDALTKLLED